MGPKPCLRHDESGATIVEFAFSGFWFFFLVVLTMEVCLLGFRTLSAQYVASETARRVILGGMTPATARTYAQGLAAKMGIAFGNLAQSPNAFSICGVTEVNPTTGQCTVQSVGRPSDFIIVRVQVTATLFMGLARYPVMGVSVAKNEHA